MKNKFNIDDKVIYEGELYIVSGIDKINGYIVYKIDPIKEDGKYYNVAEEDIEIYKTFEDLSKFELLAFIKAYDNYVDICVNMKHKPMSVEDYYSSNTYRRIQKEKKQLVLSSKFKKCMEEYNKDTKEEMWKHGINLFEKYVENTTLYDANGSAILFVGDRVLNSKTFELGEVMLITYKDFKSIYTVAYKDRVQQHSRDEIRKMK